MLYTNKDQLSVIELDNGTDSITIEKLKRVLTNRPSNIYYCVANGRLAGVISTGDIYKACVKGLNSVTINKQFTYLRAGEYMKAKSIFDEKRNINGIPVVTENKTLIGDYTRWDDLAYIKIIISTRGNRIPDWTDGKKIILVQPNKFYTDRLEVFNILKNHLEEQSIPVQSIDYQEAVKYLEQADMLLFVDENEIRAFRILLHITLGQDYDAGNGDRLQTYKNVFSSEDFCKRMYNFYLEGLHDKGINILGLVLRESSYYQKLMEELQKQFYFAGEKMWGGTLPKFKHKLFFDELYSEEYTEEILNIRTKGFVNERGLCRPKDCHGKYYNVAKGERTTVKQPEEYTKTIYIVGGCYILGDYADDAHTIESLLQMRICHMKDGGRIRVVNCGVCGADYCQVLAHIASLQLKKGDIIVVDRPPEHVKGVRYIDLNTVLEKNKVGTEWLGDWVLHCNHKVYELYAEAIYDTLGTLLTEEVEGQGQLIYKDDNYIKFLYINQYFVGFDFHKYGKVGSIVMNCNPFTYGHRYLIEQALQKVDFLFVFVVEEDQSTFSFVERFTMVSEGCADLEHVMVVPSGPFILSQMSFPEYFVKETSKDIEEHTEQDIITFAECIAPQLGIKYRFVGEEPDDVVTNQYNCAMKKILPQYGIELVEIPREKINGQNISASSARRYMEDNNMEMLDIILPSTTRKNLFGVDF